MAFYQVTDPKSGKTVTVSGDTPPSQEDADQIFQQAGLRSSQSQSQSQPQPQQAQPQGGFDLGSFLGGLTKPLRVGAEGFMDLGRAGAYGVNKLTDLIGGQNTADKNLADQQPLLVSQQEANDVANNATNPNPLKNSVVKEAAGLASWIPMFKGAGVLGALGNGAISGGLSAESQDNTTPGDILKGILGGAATGGVLHGAGSAFNKASGAFENAGNGLQNTGERVLLSQYTGANKQLEQGGADAIKNLADNYGIYNMDSLNKIAPQITGRDGMFATEVRNAVGQAGPVDVGGVLKVAQGALDNAGDIDPGPESKIMARLQKGLSNSSNTSESAATSGDISSADPKKVFQLIQDFGAEQAAYSQSAERTGSVAAHQTAAVYGTIKRELENRLFGGVDSTGNVTDNGVNNMRVKLTPDQLTQLKGINPELASHVETLQNEGILKASDLRHMQADFVQGSKAAQQATDRAGSKPISGFESLALLLNPHLWPVLAASKALNSNAGKSAIGGAAIKGGKVLQKGSPLISPEFQALIESLGAKGAATNASQ